MVPDKPFDVLALSLSGGGYRAASFHLGAMTYLNSVDYNNESLLTRTKVLSTVSGGTFPGVKYAASIQDGNDLKVCYDKLYDFMLNTDLVNDSLELLSSKNFDEFKTPNIINAFSKVYQSFEEKTFELFWNEKPNHLTEMVFNATDFSHGINFRFQKTKGDSGKFGNKYTGLSIKHIKQIKLSDVIASSSCFPAGFEPLMFPLDYKSEGADDFNNYADQLMKDTKHFPMGIMDGGIYDNPGIDGVILAKDRMKSKTHYPELQEKENPIDLYIVSDVGSKEMKPMKIHVKKPKGWFWNRSFNSFKLLGIIGWILTLAGISGLFLCSSKIWIIVLAVLSTLLSLASVVCSFLGSLLLKKIPHWFDIPSFFMRPLKFFNRLKFRTYKYLIVYRKDSVLTMVKDVFLRQISRLSYRRLYENDEWRNRVIKNAIYELTDAGDIELDDEQASQPRSTTITKSRSLTDVANKASTMETTLWFEGTPQEKKEMLDALIASGQFTMCYNLLDYIYNLKKVKEYKDYDQATKTAITQLENKISDDWKRFNDQPYWMIKK